MPHARPALRVTTALVAAFATVALLAGCGSHDSSTAKDTPTAGSTASAAPSDGAGTSAESASPTPTPTPTPVTLQQGEVWTAQQVYDYNPNFSPAPDYKVQDGSAASKLVDLKGVSFGWINQTSNDTIEIAVAHPSADNIDQFSGEVAGSSQQVPIDGAPAGTVGYFDVKDGTGTLQVFTANGYWLVVDSKLFLEPGDSYQIATDVMGNLK